MHVLKCEECNFIKKFCEKEKTLLINKTFKVVKFI